VQEDKGELAIVATTIQPNLNNSLLSDKQVPHITH
jgi:hypothetical protein